MGFAPLNPSDGSSDRVRIGFRKAHRDLRAHVNLMPASKPLRIACKPASWQPCASISAIVDKT